MGWLSYNASFYKKDGKVDAKKEMDHIYAWKSEGKEACVLKSSMKGTVYYAAVQITDTKENTKDVVAVICLTSTSKSDGMNFGYKSMDETMHPYYYDCPLSILNLLTPTDSDAANEWRKRCREEINSPLKKLSKLPVGTRIKWTKKSGEEIQVMKHAPAYQFKKPFWYCPETGCYVRKRSIPADYQIV